jgi:hypothetical protein
MRMRALMLLLAASLLPLGCDSGGPSIGSATPAKSEASGAASADASKAKVSPRMEKKREKMGKAPSSASD